MAKKSSGYVSGHIPTPKRTSIGGQRLKTSSMNKSGRKDLVNPGKTKKPNQSKMNSLTLKVKRHQAAVDAGELRALQKQQYLWLIPRSRRQKQIQARKPQAARGRRSRMSRGQGS